MNVFNKCLKFLQTKNSPLQAYYITRTFPKYFSSVADKFVSVSEDENTKTAVITMQRPPVNSLNLELLQQITTAIKDLESQNFKGLVLTSSFPTVFSSGLDIMELYKPKEERLRAFWKSLQEMWKTLYLTPLITMAAVNGHAPAGGCMLTLSCDYRVMVKCKISIGMNETLLGIAAPKWFRALLINNIGFREAEKALNLGKLFTPEEALALKIVDDLAVDAQELQSKIQQQMQIWLKIPGLARQATKQYLHRPLVEDLESYQNSEIDEIVLFCQTEAVQKALGKYIEQLKSKKG